MARTIIWVIPTFTNQRILPHLIAVDNFNLGYDSACITAHFEAVLVLESAIFSLSHHCYPSKHAGSDSPPIRIGSEALARSAWMMLAQRLTSGSDPFSQNLTQSARTNRIRAGFGQYDPGRLLKNTTEAESGEPGSGPVAFCQNWARWFFHTDLLPDKLCFPKTWQGHPDRIRVSFAHYDPCFV